MRVLPPRAVRLGSSRVADAGMATVRADQVEALAGALYRSGGRHLAPRTLKSFASEKPSVRAFYRRMARTALEALA